MVQHKIRMTYETKIDTPDGWRQDELVYVDGKEIGYVRIEQKGPKKVVTTHCNDEEREGARITWLVQRATESDKS